ncbi:MAG: hypothetical protein WKF37_16005 [Bryobacteraceae bacterium]
MKHFFRRFVPDLHRIVLVESGARELYEDMLPGLYENCPEVDLVTCFAGVPKAFRPEQGRVYSISDYVGAEGRSHLVNELRQRHYAAIGIICAAQPIMTKWKWMLAAKVPAKLFLINENGDHFWFDYSNWRTIKHFILYRAGLSGAGAVGTVARLLLFPFTVVFLLLYAGFVHARRALRSG